MQLHDDDMIVQTRNPVPTNHAVQAVAHSSMIGHIWLCASFAHTDT